MSGTSTELANQPVVSSVDLPTTKIPALNASGTAVIVEGSTLIDTILTSIGTNEIANTLGPYLSTPTLVNIPNTSIYHRDVRMGGLYGKGYGAIQVQVSVLFPLTLLEYQLRDADSGTIVQTWSPLATTVAAGLSTFPATVPAGMHHYYLDLRPNGIDGAVVQGTQMFMMGEVLAIGGQSLATRMQHQFVDTTPTSSFHIPDVSQWYRIFASWQEPSGVVGALPPIWSLAVDGSITTPTFNSSFIPEIAYLAVTAFGVPVAVVGWTHGSTAISAWQPGQVNYTNLITILQQAGGKFGTFIWNQGHSDSAAGTTSVAWQAGLTTLIQGIQSQFAAAYNFKVIVDTIPDITAGAWGNGDAIQVIRGAGIAWVNALNATAANSAVYLTELDTSLVDGTHPDQSGSVSRARLFFRAWSRMIGQDPVGNQGPIIASASLSGSTITLATTLPGGTALVGVGDLTTQFQAYQIGQTSAPYTLSSVTFSGTSILLGLGSTPPGSVDVWYRRAPDAIAAVYQAGIYDNNLSDAGLSSGILTQGRQLQLLPTGFVTAYGAALIQAYPPLGGSTAAAGAYATAVVAFQGRTPTLVQYALDGSGTFTTVTSPLIYTGTISFKIPTAALSAGAHTIIIKVTNPDGVATSSSINWAVSSLWTPTCAAVPLLAWFDASATGGAMFDTGFVNPQTTNGGTVSALVDFSGNAHHAVARTGFGLPTLSTTGINSRAALNFAYASGAMLGSAAGETWMASLDQSDLSISAVIKPTSLAGSSLRAIMAIGNSGSGLDEIIMWQSAQSPNATKAEAGRYTSVANNLLVSAAVAAAQTQKEILRTSITSLTQGLTVNSITEVTGSIAGTNSSGTWNNFAIGQNQKGTGDALDALVAEIPIFQGYLSNGDLSSLATYMTAKWGS